jgi:aromatic-L-amino-acid decarboxylase
MAPVQPGFLRDLLPNSAPEHGEEWSKIAEDYQTKILPGMTHWQHPSFFAYFPANTTFEGMLADLHAAAVSNPGFNWSVSPSATELELITLDWVARMFGLSDDFLTTSANGGGIILNSASEVAITIAVAARERALKYVEAAEGDANGSHAQPDMQQLAAWRGRATGRFVMYGTTQTHSIGVKAAMILGLAFETIEVHAKDDFAMRGEALRKALRRDKERGLVPFMIIATVGTTSSGAVDDLDEIARVCQEEGCEDIWIHVDAAYAGVCLALPELRETCALDVINTRVDSFSTNLHKWGLVTFDCSPVYVRRRADLQNALTVTPEFLRTKHGDAGSVLDLRNMQLSLGRRFRSLKVWFVLRSYGQEGFRTHLRRHIELSKQFNELLASEKSVPLAIVAKPRWSLTVFRLQPATFESTQLDTLNRRFWDALQQRNKDLLLTQTVLPDIGFCIRMAIGGVNTQLEHVQQAFHGICSVARKVLDEA